MILRNHMKDPATAMRIGMSFLILASLARWFLHPSAKWSLGIVDGATGLLYGLAIGCLLLAVRQRRRRNGSEKPDPPA